MHKKIFFLIAKHIILPIVIIVLFMLTPVPLRADPLNAVDEPFFGMQLESASLSNGKVTVITTGAKYILSSSEMLLIRRIDPKMNSYSDRQVARLCIGVHRGQV